jgi:hypothetical protein
VAQMPGPTVSRRGSRPASCRRRLGASTPVNRPACPVVSSRAPTYGREDPKQGGNVRTTQMVLVGLVAAAARPAMSS